MQVPHLASHLLGAMTRRLPAEWARVYGHPVYFAETFIDPTRFRGTCYRAANWLVLGRTTGRGKADLTHRPNRPLKEVLGIPLLPDFRARLTGTPRGAGAARQRGRHPWRLRSRNWPRSSRAPGAR